MNYKKTDMLRAIFPDSCASININEYLLCINLSTVGLIRHCKIISRTRKYNYSSTIK